MGGGVYNESLLNSEHLYIIGIYIYDVSGRDYITIVLPQFYGPMGFFFLQKDEFGVT